MLTLLLAGCASRGNEVLKGQDTSSINLTIVDGQTTREEVQRIYGAPAQTNFLSEKNEVWTYRWSRATAQGQNFIPVVGAFVRGYDVRKKELVIVFDERNVVARHTMTDNNNSIKTGLIDGGAATPLGGNGSVSSPTTSASSPSYPATPAPSTPLTPSSVPTSAAPASAMPTSSVGVADPAPSTMTTGSPAPSDPASGPVTGLSRYRL